MMFIYTMQDIIAIALFLLFTGAAVLLYLWILLDGWIKTRRRRRMQKEKEQ